MLEWVSECEGEGAADAAGAAGWVPGDGRLTRTAIFYAVCLSAQELWKSNRMSSKRASTHLQGPSNTRNPVLTKLVHFLAIRRLRGIISSGRYLLDFLNLVGVKNRLDKIGDLVLIEKQIPTQNLKRATGCTQPRVPDPSSATCKNDTFPCIRH